MKYLVMECFTSYAVLLDEEGRFVKAANLQYQVGQTVESPVLMKEEKPRAKNLYKFTRFAAVAASLLLLVTIYSQNYLISYASIYMTINPSICMELNRKGQVIKVSGVNEDGVKLLENYKLTSKDRLVVTDELIERAIDMGFLAEGGQVMIDIDAPDEAHFQEYGKDLRENLNQYLDETMTIEIQIQSYSVETLNQRLEDKAAGKIPNHENTDYGTSDYGPMEDGDSAYAEPQSDSSSDYDSEHDSDSNYGVDDNSSGYDSDDDSSSSYSDEGSSGYDDDDDDD